MTQEAWGNNTKCTHKYVLGLVPKGGMKAYSNGYSYFFRNNNNNNKNKYVQWDWTQISSSALIVFQSCINEIVNFPLTN